MEIGILTTAVAGLLFVISTIILAIAYCKSVLDHKRKLKNERNRRLTRAISEVYEFSEQFRKSSMQNNLYSHDDEFPIETREYFETCSEVWGVAASKLKDRLVKLQEERDG
jgi:hypothetical protein